MDVQGKKFSFREGIEILCVLLIVFCALYALIPIQNQTVKNIPLAEGFHYSGMTNGKYPHGKGEVDSFLGSSYTGDFQDGFFYGEGTFISKEGWTYQGTFKKGLPIGGGTIHTPQGLIWRSKDGGAWEKSSAAPSPEKENESDSSTR